MELCLCLVVSRPTEDSTRMLSMAALGHYLQPLRHKQLGHLLLCSFVNTLAVLRDVLLHALCSPRHHNVAVPAPWLAVTDHQGMP